MSAADKIRASVDAMPEGFKTPWTWEASSNQVRPTGDESRPYVVASCGFARSAAHIALLASPHVAAALADLLDAEAEVREWQARKDAWIAADELEPWAQGAAKADIRRRQAFDALEAAIDRSGT